MLLLIGIGGNQCASMSQRIIYIHKGQIHREHQHIQYIALDLRCQRDNSINPANKIVQILPGCLNHSRFLDITGADTDHISQLIVINLFRQCYLFLRRIAGQNNNIVCRRRTCTCKSASNGTKHHIRIGLCCDDLSALRRLLRADRNISSTGTQAGKVCNQHTEFLMSINNHTLCLAGYNMLRQIFASAIQISIGDRTCRGDYCGLLLRMFKN